MKNINRWFVGKIIRLMTVLLLLPAVLLTGCSEQTESSAPVQTVQADGGTTQKSDGMYSVYYKNADGDTLTERRYRPVSETFDEILSELLIQLAASPAEDAVTTLGAEVTFNTFSRGVDNITIDLSSDYLALGNADQVLLRAAVVKTLVQLSGVEKIYLTVEGQAVTNEAGEPIGPMDDDTFIATHGEGINSFQTAELTLYFASSQGRGLEEEIRTVRYSSNYTLEEVVADALIDGTQDPNLISVAGADTTVNSISVDGVVCWVDFAENVNTYSGKADAETALYAFVNSICANCEGIESVRFTISGSYETRFRNQINLDQTFLPRLFESEAEPADETERNFIE